MDMNLTLAQVQAWLPKSQLVGNGGTLIRRVHTDTRSTQSGDLFIAIKGERFDAHEFLGLAAEQSASAAIATHGLTEANLPGLLVADTRLALGQLAKAWRSQFNLHSIAVTGSNGKTTVTQMIASILRAWKPNKAWAPTGSFNNDIGVPLTLLGLTAQHEAAVFELGMNHPGEIGYLAPLVQPSVALVNNAQREHLEFMHTVDAVAAENGSVFHSLSAQGTAVFPANSPHTDFWRALAKRQSAHRQIMTFAANGDVHGHGVWFDGAWTVHANTPDGPLSYRLRIAGEHNVTNSLAAAACSLAAGASIDSVVNGLEAFEAVNGRSKTLVLKLTDHQLTIVDDSYNANPDSVRAAIDVLAQLPGPRVLVLGDMGEVGNAGPQLHTEIGDFARSKKIEHLLCLGPLSRYSAIAAGSAVHFDDLDTLQRALSNLLPTAKSIVIKGSRFMRMERVVTHVMSMSTEPKNSIQGFTHAP